MKARLFDGSRLIAEDVSQHLWRSSLAFPVSDDRDVNGEPTWIDISNLSVQIGPAPEAALEFLMYDRYWNGSITLPLRDLPWRFGDERTVLLDAHGIAAMPVDRDGQHHLAAITPHFEKPK